MLTEKQRNFCAGFGFEVSKLKQRLCLLLFMAYSINSLKITVTELSSKCQLMRPLSTETKMRLTLSTETNDMTDR